MLTTVKRALRNLVRLPGRSGIVCFILTILVVMVTVGLSVQAGAQAGVTSVRQSLGNKVILRPNLDTLRAGLRGDGQGGGFGGMGGGGLGGGRGLTNLQLPTITEDTVAPIIDSAYVIAWDIISTSSFTTELETVEPEQSGETTGLNAGRGQIFLGGAGSGFIMPALRATGSSHPELLDEFLEGSKELVDGRFYTPDEVAAGALVAVIDEEFAALNELTLDSTFEVGTIQGETRPLTVVGIYRTHRGLEQAIPGIPSTVPNNTLYVPRTILPATGGTAYFFLDDPLNTEAFIKEAAANGLDLETYTLDAQDQQFQAMAGPLASLADVARLGTLSILVAGGLILILTMALITRERKLEIGILRALGTTKRAIAGQLAVETVSLVLAALLVGGAVGAGAAQAAGDWLLQREIAATQTAQSNAPVFGQVVTPGGFVGTSGRGPAILQGMRGGGPTQLPQAVTTIQSTFGGRELGLLILTGLGLALAGALTAAYLTVKVEPAEILAGRN